MERRRRPPAMAEEAAEEIPRGGASSPPPNPTLLLRDVSNYKTPHPSLPNPKNHNPPSPLPIFFTAYKNTLTPAASSSASAFRRRPSAVNARRLRALELDQSKSSRKVQIRREKALKSLSKSLSSWLNLLFRNPSSCGCDIASRRENSGSIGKRQSLDGEREMGVGGRWRSPKRRRDRLWKCGGEEKKGFSSGMVASLKVSLQDVCSFDDLKERMEGYITREGCDEVLLMMHQVCKNIDEGRLKMKANCPLVSDLRLKERATRILMCYNPEWLRVGLHVVLGGDSLSCNEEREQEKEDLFLRMIIEKQFFSHSGVAKSFAYNKLVEGLYRPGYFEALGSIILKRFMLLVISLDKAKTESSLPIKYGIDGLDGGSPLLFCRHSNIKSSQQIIHESLSEVMHGEGDLLVHLTIVGCKLNYVQSTISEYDFIVRNLFQDLHDGILLCRALQLLLRDASIISKVVAPSDTRKKNLQNCSIAIEYLKQVGVPLSAGDGVMVVAEDIANGDKELIISLLWSVFVHLQDLPKYNTETNMSLLLEWIQPQRSSILFRHSRQPTKKTKGSMPERYSYSYEVVADEKRLARTEEPVIPPWSSMFFGIALRVRNIIQKTDEHGVRRSVYAGRRFKRNLIFPCVRLCPDRENFYYDGVSAEASKILASILEAFTGHVMPESTREAMAGDFGRLACRMLRDERYAKCRKLQVNAMIFIFSASPMISRLSSRPPEPTSARVIEALQRCQLIPSGSEEETCAICLAEIPAQSAITRLPCHHFFHDECIVPWLRINRVCPLCGFVLPR